MIETSLELRQRMTPAEERLWDVLRSRAVTGERVRRQHAAGRYVLDFWIPAFKLAIELDGSVHDEPHAVAQDIERTAWFEAQGIRVLRFRNEQVLQNLDRVIVEIQKAIAHQHLNRIDSGQ
jgi:very-short-patch-repair endonuclease